VSKTPDVDSALDDAVVIDPAPVPKLTLETVEASQSADLDTSADPRATKLGQFRVGVEL
jgi:hypothetical protein